MWEHTMLTGDGKTYLNKNDLDPTTYKARLAGLDLRVLSSRQLPPSPPVVEPSLLLSAPIRAVSSGGTASVSNGGTIFSQTLDRLPDVSAFINSLRSPPRETETQLSTANGSTLRFPEDNSTRDMLIGFAVLIGVVGAAVFIPKAIKACTVH